jgi:hypothetical protein
MGGDGGSGLRQRNGYGCTQAAGRAGDKSDFAVETEGIEDGLHEGSW